MKELTNEEKTRIEIKLEETFEDGMYTIIDVVEEGIIAITDNPYQKNEDGSCAQFLYTNDEIKELMEEEN